MRRFFIALVMSLLALLPAMAADQGPDGTIELSGGSVAVGIGYSWGSGKLVFQGKQYSRLHGHGQRLQSQETARYRRDLRCGDRRSYRGRRHERRGHAESKWGLNPVISNPPRASIHLCPSRN